MFGLDYLRNLAARDAAANRRAPAAAADPLRDFTPLTQAAPKSSPLIVKLTGATPAPTGQPGWLYEWAQVTVYADRSLVVAPNAATGTVAKGNYAINLNELGMLAGKTGTQPNGYNEARSAFPAGVAIRSVLGQNGDAIVVVRLFSIALANVGSTTPTYRLAFERTNPEDGSCT